MAEHWSEDAATRSWLVKQAAEFGQVVSKVRRGKDDPASKFAMYFEHQEPLKRMPSHRLLAMQRGEAEEVLRVGLQLDDELVLRKLKPQWVTNPQFEFYQDLLQTAEDCYQRLLLPATESAALQAAKEKADEEAIAVFAKNLRELLLAPPAGPHVTIGIDPGFRTGCKVAVVDGTGKFLAHTTIYPTPPHNDAAGAARTLLELIAKFEAKLIAIGNGTASRETDAFVTDTLRTSGLQVTKVVVSESGASIYSASEAAAREYPDLDVTVRGAISIAHRLQDPLAELVKIDPKSIGVGQYQHDVNQTRLRKCLDREVQSCVNSVGVDVNMASAPLLSYVAGIGPKLAQRIVEYRDAHGRFERREQLCKVPKLGQKAFEQAAGFLRIRDGQQPLDNSAVHPESYYVVERMASHLTGRDETTGRQCGLGGQAQRPRLRRRASRPPHRPGHSRRVGQTGPRSAQRVQGGQVHRRRSRLGGLERRHDPGGDGHERHAFRSFRGYRSAPGRTDPHLAALQHLRPGPQRSDRRRGCRARESPGSRSRPPPHRLVAETGVRSMTSPGATHVVQASCPVDNSRWNPQTAGERTNEYTVGEATFPRQIA